MDVFGTLLFFFVASFTVQFAQACTPENRTEMALNMTTPPTRSVPMCPSGQWFLSPQGRCYIFVPSVVYDLIQDHAKIGCKTQYKKSELVQIDDEEERKFVQAQMIETNNQVASHGRAVGAYWARGRANAKCDSVEIVNNVLVEKSILCREKIGFICEAEAAS